MRLGNVKINISYTVDLDNLDMVEHAKDAIYDDIENAVKFNELWGHIIIEPSTNAIESDIPDFLKEEY